MAIVYGDYSLEAKIVIDIIQWVMNAEILFLVLQIMRKNKKKSKTFKTVTACKKAFASLFFSNKQTEIIQMLNVLKII